MTARRGSDGWGGDYSILLQSIENRIGENAADTSIDLATLNTPGSAGRDSSLKRRRTSEFDTPGSEMQFGSALKMRSLAEMDELTIQNEQLRDQLERLKSEQQAAREEHVRQLKFMEDKCISLKKESSERLERYYEEKKKWQATQRETELLLKKAVEKQPAAAQPQKEQTSGSSQRDELIMQKLRSLEATLASKVNEARKNLDEKLIMESKLFEAETELKTLRSAYGAGSANEEASTEARVLRKQFSDMESAFKRTTRDHDSMKLKLKNQGLLEEELSTVKSKLRIAEETLNAQKHLQLEHQQLHEEKRLWTQLFQDVVTEAMRSQHAALLAEDDSALDFLASSASSSMVTVSPTQVLHLLSAYQKKCAVLLQCQGQLQHSLSEIRRQLRESQVQHQKTETDKWDVESRLEKAELQLRSAKQQGRLFEGEISSLRSLLKTFDVEFSIGKPDAAKVLALKDKLVADLRGDLDTCRAEALSYVGKLRAVEATSEERSAALAALEAEVAELRSALAAKDAMEVEVDNTTVEGLQQALTAQAAELETAKTDLLYFQHVTGLDYLPDRTQVLHMPVNPSQHVPLGKTVPTVKALYEMRAEHQGQLLACAASAATAASSSSSSAPASVPSSAASASSATDADDSAEHEGGAMNMSVMGGVGAPASSSSGGSGSCAHCGGNGGAGADSSKLNLRLKEIFKERINSFREGVYLLTGFKVDLYAPDAGNSLPRLRLRSMFAEKPEDCLMFQLRGDAPELLDTEFASRLGPEHLHYLTTGNSAPAFLASVTLELFDNLTFMG